MTIPSFPIAIERVQNKSLRNRPIAVAQTDAARSRCLALSDEARRMGIRVGNTIGEARRKCRDLIVCEPNLDLYRRAQEAVGKIVAEYSPLVEPARSGRHYLDLTGSERLFGSPRNVAEVIRKRINQTLTLPADAGLAVNKLVSRIAAIDAVRCDLVEVPHGSERSYLSPHQVDVLPAVIKETRTRLIDLNIRLVEQVNGLTCDLLYAAVGPTAFLVSRQSQGIDPSPVTPPGSERHIVLAQELPEDSNNRDVIELSIHNLALDAILRLNTSGYDAGELIITLTYSDRKIERKSLNIPPAGRSGDKLLASVVDTFAAIPLRRIRVRRVELDFRNLLPHVSQGVLWECASTPIAGREKPQSVSTLSKRHDIDTASRTPSLLDALNVIRTRFGSSAIAWGTT